MHGYWAWDWANSYERVQALDVDQHLIKTASPHGLYGFRKGQRFYFLNVPDNDAVRADPAATFLAWDNGRFVDVTADVRARRREVKFFDNRPPG